MRFAVKFNQTSQRIPVQFKSIDRKFNIDFQAVQVVNLRPEKDYYEGSYEVIPTITAQQLETKQKFLTENIKIKEIPFYNVSNTSGGNTVYIGKEVD